MVLVEVLVCWWNADEPLSLLYEVKSPFIDWEISRDPYAHLNFPKFLMGIGVSVRSVQQQNSLAGAPTYTTAERSR